jgi:hypothetical protein
LSCWPWPRRCISSKYCHPCPCRSTVHSRRARFLLQRAVVTDLGATYGASPVTSEEDGSVRMVPRSPTQVTRPAPTRATAAAESADCIISHSPRTDLVSSAGVMRRERAMKVRAGLYRRKSMLTRWRLGPMREALALGWWATVTSPMTQVCVGTSARRALKFRQESVPASMADRLHPVASTDVPQQLPAGFPLVYPLSGNPGRK